MTKSVDAAVELVEALSQCRCCLQRAPDRELDKPYTRHGKSEIYLDMLKECFSIHLTSSSDECGICEACVGRLRDASDFKLQVQRSQAKLRERLERALQLLGDDAKAATEEEPYEISSDEESLESQDSESDEDSALTHAEDTHTDSAGLRAEEACTRDTCGEQLADNTDFDEHSHTLAQPTVDNTCQFCNKKFKNRTQLSTHIRTHTGEKPYACMKCSRRFAQRQNMIRHERNRSCHYYFKNTVNRLTKAITQNRSESSKINKNLSTKVITDSAANSSKNSETFTPASTTDLEYSCETCGKEFATRTQLKGHVIHHKKKKFQCKICQKRFLQKAYLKVHLKLHTGEKRFSCPTCKRRFAVKGTLDKHIKTHTGEKPYSCEVCKKRFTVKSNMLRHAKTHTIRKPFPCNLCPQGFTRKSSLNEHIKAHIIYEKIYRCEICNTSFTRKSTFVIHVEECISKLGLDNTENKFVCDICSKQFNLKRNLKSHMKLHT